jgi:hypothetical protein
MEQQSLELTEVDDWKINNMEYDLCTTDWIINKAKASRVYSQNLYSALCNNDFVKNDVWPLLTDTRWHCSWRYAGGIVSKMREEGDYLDWYCSGIIDPREVDDEQFFQFTKEEQEEYVQYKQYVNESVVTEEIRNDLLILGWLVK